MISKKLQSQPVECTCIKVSYDISLGCLQCISSKEKLGKEGLGPLFENAFFFFKSPSFVVVIIYLNLSHVEFGAKQHVGGAGSDVSSGY